MNGHHLCCGSRDTKEGKNLTFVTRNRNEVVDRAIVNHGVMLSRNRMFPGKYRCLITNLFGLTLNRYYFHSKDRLD